jgi:hypothetical protein
MHFISKTRNGALIAFVSIILFASCGKSSSGGSQYFTADDNGGYASDASRIELANDDAISMADAAGTYYNADFIGSTASGVTVSTDTVSIPHTLIIRFGTTDVVCLDGKKRSGAIIISYSGEYTDTAQPHTITFDNYTINDNQLTGSVEVTRVDTTVAGNWYYKERVTETMNMGTATNNTQTVIWNGSLVRKWVTGYATGTRTDDVFSISGSANLTRANGSTYSFGLATPLQIAMDCNFAEAGVVDVSGYSGARTLNYGSGTCDAYAQVTLGQDNSVHNVILLQ